MATAPDYAGAWESLHPPLDVRVRDAVEGLGFGRMTPVQASAIPQFLSHRDVIVEAITGSGKTFAYIIPILQMLLKEEEPLDKKDVFAVILCPTRELAKQVAHEFTRIVQVMELDGREIRDPFLLTGGRPLQKDIEDMRTNGANIIVGTPGRTEEFLFGSVADDAAWGSVARSRALGKSGGASNRKGHLSVKRVEVVILDEADRLLDMGFQASLTRILTNLPRQRRTGLFSATLTDAMNEVARIGLRNPVKVAVSNKKNTEKTPSGLVNMYSVVPNAGHKLAYLMRVLHEEVSQGRAKKFIVYVLTGNVVDYLFKVLTQVKELSPYRVLSLHGKMSPNRRNATYEAFYGTPPGTPSVLLCTDVAARGLDIPEVDMVVQLDPPQDPRAFTHRCGRTARAGRAGRAVVFLTEGREEDYVEFMRIRKVPLQRIQYGASNGLDEETERLAAEIRNVVKLDRELHDKAVRGFVSTVRAYTKHEESYIFQIKNVDLVSVARSMGLFRVPRMPEIGDGAGNLYDMDWDNYEYANEIKEAKRKEDLQNGAASKAKKLFKKHEESVAWSKKAEEKERKAERREKRVARAQAKRTRDMSWLQDPDDSGRSSDEDEDWKEHAREIKMARKRGPREKEGGMDFSGLA